MWQNHWAQSDSCRQKWNFEVFNVWNSEIHKKGDCPSSSVSSSSAWVPFQQSPCNPHGCHQRLKALVHRPMYIFFNILLYELIIYAYMVSSLGKYWPLSNFSASLVSCQVSCFILGKFYLININKKCKISGEACLWRVGNQRG